MRVLLLLSITLGLTLVASSSSAELVDIPTVLVRDVGRNHAER
jgi:hypothetical protein